MEAPTENRMKEIRKQMNDEKDLQLARSIEELPDLDPPPDLLGAIMGAIMPKRLTVWRRVCLWARAPRSITYTPVRVVPVSLAIVAVLIAGLLFTSTRKDPLPLPDHGRSRFPVHLTLKIPGAHSVSVVGTFNNWATQEYEMHWDKHREMWSITLWLPEGRHEYGFWVDGTKVISDPEALLSQDDGFGNRNSVLILREKNGAPI